MAHLRPCTTCSRHVDAAETSCPFCDGALAVEAPVPAAPVARLGRAAAMAVGAAVATASLAACGNTPTQVNSPTADGGTTTTVTPPGTGSTPPPDYSNMAKPYGAPPADGLTRVV